MGGFFSLSFAERDYSRQSLRAILAAVFLQQVL
jgi:hypothetical protein